MLSEGALLLEAAMLLQDLHLALHVRATQAWSPHHDCILAAPRAAKLKLELHLLCIACQILGARRSLERHCRAGRQRWRAPLCGKSLLGAVTVFAGQADTVGKHLLAAGPWPVPSNNITAQQAG